MADHHAQLASVPRRSLLRTAFTARIATDALGVSLVVGTILNAINQGEAIVGGGVVSWPHVILNFAVPYCVASFSAARNQLRG